MAINVGDKIPESTLMIMGERGPQPTQTSDLFAGKKTALFSVPGAFTPTCSAKHLPSFVNHAGDLSAKGVDQIVCMSVNDVFVMSAWGKDQNTGDKVVMAADGNGDLAKAMGLEFDGTGFGMGTRGQRFAMVINDGTVEKLFIEEPGSYEVSSAEHILANL